MAEYLAGQDGFKASTVVMHEWLDNHPPYQVNHESIVISQLKADQYEFLKADILAVTVTKPMFEQLCGLDENSFLHKSLWDVLKQARA